LPFDNKRYLAEQIFQGKTMQETTLYANAYKTDKIPIGAHPGRFTGSLMKNVPQKLGVRSVPF
jgi:hypothetical protein